MSNAKPQDKYGLDVIQAHLIHALFRHAIDDEITLKGGQAMRFHGSYRSTKDIDLQSDPTYPLSAMQARIRKAIKDVTESGLLQGAKVTEPKQTDTVARWKIAGHLPHCESPIHMTLEVSRRSQPDSDIIDSWHAPVPGLAGTHQPADQSAAPSAGSQIRLYSRQAMAAAKVAALCSPNRVAPRDIQDLMFLITTEVEPPIALLAGAGPEFVDDALENLWAKLETNGWDQCRAHLLPALPDAVAAKVDEGRWDDIRLLVGETVEDWLRRARLRINEAAPAQDNEQNLTFQSASNATPTTSTPTTPTTPVTSETPAPPSMPF